MLDDYIKKIVNQNIKRKLTVCFILTKEADIIIGYYTLSSDNIPLSELPEEIIKKMPRSYKNLPTTLIGRLAVDEKYKNKGYGRILLLDALERCYDISTGNIGSMAVVVDPLDNDAVKFYEHYGFIKLPDSGKMFLEMKKLRELFKI